MRTGVATENLRAGPPRPDPALQAEPSSFRDPAGQVIEGPDGRVFRSVAPAAVEEYRHVRSCGAVEALIVEGGLVAAEEVDPAEAGLLPPPGGLVLEHPRLPFVSYPYEWPFSLLKAAALMHLEMQIRLLDRGISLSDASAYNVQFQGAKPVFIDWLSMRRYREGEYWQGHNQFCEQFLNPLLLSAKLGAPHNAWYRGMQEGVPGRELAALLPRRMRWSPRMQAHVLLPLRFERRAGSRSEAAKRTAKRPLPRNAYRGLLAQLRRWIEGLEPRGTNTNWSDYSSASSYDSGEASRKAEAVRTFVAEAKPEQLWDLGCNTGEFAAVALEAGAGDVIGFDSDFGALESACERARTDRLRFLPLYQDLANPSPDQGWGQAERRSLTRRSSSADALMALAVVHHLAIGRNVPLPRIAAWLVSLAPRGLVEFVPQGDPRVDDLLTLRGDRFADYAPEAWEAALEPYAAIRNVDTVSASGRRLYTYERR